VRHHQQELPQVGCTHTLRPECVWRSHSGSRGAAHAVAAQGSDCAQQRRMRAAPQRRPMALLRTHPAVAHTHTWVEQQPRDLVVPPVGGPARWQRQHGPLDAARRGQGCGVGFVRTQRVRWKCCLPCGQLRAGSAPAWRAPQQASLAPTTTACTGPALSRTHLRPAVGCRGTR
jgi:hypothetical protein